jgi:NAD(P)-dependent dehydrogenase (short-subunit alcohol dehydrogenase family)
MSKKRDRTDRYKSPAAAILTGISDLCRRPANNLTLNSLQSLEGKKVMITGASSGLGKAIAVELASRGAHVIMAVRSGIPDKGEDVKKKSGSAKVDMIHMDLSDLASLKNLCSAIRLRFGLLDLVICNAAMVTKKAGP